MHARTLKILLLTAVLLLSACSMVRVAYSNGEFLSYWWLNSYIDVSPTQKPWVKTRIKSLFEWHRKTQLQDYVGLLKLAQRQLQHPVDKAVVLEDLAEVKKRLAIIVDHALPDMVDLALDLRPQQIDEIAKKFASSNNNYRNDYLRGDLAKRQHYRFVKVRDQAEYWFGNLTREQEASLRKALDAVPLDNDRVHAARMQRQRDVLELLKKIQAEKPGRDITAQLLREQALALFEAPGGAQHAAFYQSYYDGMTNVAVMMINGATPAQRAHANQKLQEYVDDFSRLLH